MKLRPFDVVMAVGKRGSGKSTRMKKLTALQPRAAWFDPNNEYSRHAPKKAQVDQGPLRDICTPAELEANPDWLNARNLSLAIVPESTDPREIAEDLKSVLELVRETDGGFFFGIDEVGKVKKYAEPEIDELATQSRHYGTGVSVGLVAQRATGIPKTAREQVSILYTGKQTSPADLDALEDLVINTMTKDEAEAFVRDVGKLKRPGILEWEDAS